MAHSYTKPSPKPVAVAPRRRDAAATRRRLMQAGRRAFAQKGLAGAVLIDDILRPAGVSTGSFYHQFRDKNELLVAILDEHAGAFRARLLRTLEQPDQAGRSGFVGLARACFGLALDMAEDDGDLLCIERRERDSDDPVVAGYLRQNQESWIERVAAYLARGSADDFSEADCRLAAQFVIHLGLTSVAHYQDLPQDERPEARERLLDALVRFTMGGLPALTRERRSVSSARDPGRDSGRE
jgi:AcrR family transcriptional regulator